jgi:hypothetical protein
MGKSISLMGQVIPFQSSLDDDWKNRIRVSAPALELEQNEHLERVKRYERSQRLELQTT